MNEREHDIQVLNLELFDAAFLVAPGDEEKVKRCFMTLFVRGDVQRKGASALLDKATNVLGETFALKRLRVREEAPEGSLGAVPQRKELRRSFSSSDASVSGSLPTPDYVTRGHVAAFFEEYRTQLALSSLRGFPKLYGFGISGGSPCILMEWVEGVALQEAVHGKEPVVSCPLPPATVAAFGTAVLDVLIRAGELDEGFVHRDLSPRNIMLRSDRVSIEDQFASASFDLCLVDFGSSTLRTDPATVGEGFTARADVWRMGTPAYAPPEMLTSDVELPEGYRNSATIDSYALCSVLYELYSGSRPFDLKAHGDFSVYRVKTETAPAPLAPREGDGGALAGIIMAGLSVQQHDRPTLRQLADALDNWQQLPLQRTVGSLDGAKPAERGFWQPDRAQTLLTRRRFVAGGIVAAAAVVSGAIVAGKMLGHGAPALDEDRYVRTASTYSGEPLFKVLDHGSKSWALCTASGRVVCAPVSSRECGALRQGMSALYDDASQLYGYITPTDNEDGYAWIVLPAFADAGDYSEGYAPACDRSTRLWGYIDVHGAWVLPAQYRTVGTFSNGAAAVLDSNSDLWGAVNAQGDWVVEPSFTALGARSDDGFAVAEQGDKRWGIVGAQGSFAPVDAVALRRFAFGLAPALDAVSGLWGYVDSSGSWRVKPVFKDARPFCSATETQTNVPSVLAAVQDAASQLWYFIEPDGAAHGGMKPRFWKLGDLHDGLAPAQASPEDSTVVFDEHDPDSRTENAGKRYGYVDASGRWQMKRLATLVDTGIPPAGI